MPFEPPDLIARWGPYYRPNFEEQLAMVNTAQAALGQTKNGGEQIISAAHAVQYIASIFGIENAKAALETIQGEKDDRAEQELDAAKATLQAKAGAQGPGTNAPGGATQPGDSGGGTASGKNNAGG